MPLPFPHARADLAAELRRTLAVLRYARPYWRGWAGIVLATLAATGLALLQPWPMKLAVDHVLRVGPTDHRPPAWLDALPGAASPLSLLGWLVAAQVTFFLAATVLDAASAWLWVRVGQAATYDLAGDVFASLQRRGLAFHARASVGDLMERTLGNTGCVQSLVGQVILRPLTAGLTVVAALSVMLWLDPWLTGVMLAAAPLMALGAAVMSRPIKRTSRRASELRGQLSAHVEQTLGGLTVVQAFGREPHQHARLLDVQGEVLTNQRRGVLLRQASQLLAGLPPAMAVAVVLWVGATRVLDGALTLGSLLVFLSYANTLKGRLKGLAKSGAQAQSVRADVERVAEVLLAEPEVRDAPDARPLKQSRGGLRIDDVTFGYDPDRPVLRGVTLDVSPGETLALVGATGAGKSTIAALIPRLIDPQRGRVLLDGRDVCGLRLADVRRQVSLVPQEPLLLPASVAENIAYARPGATRDEVEAAARAAGADAFIRRLPRGYDTVLAERGATLSGGERQRLSIARAVLRDAPILVLDEPTSALDAETEDGVLRALEALRPGRTCVVIAHRLSTIRGADRIAVIDAGRVAEVGTHAALLAAGGLYADLCAAASPTRKQRRLVTA